MSIDSKSIDGVMLQGIYGGTGNRKSPVDLILEQMALMAQYTIDEYGNKQWRYGLGQHIEEGVDYIIEDGVLYFYLHGIYDRWRKMARTTEFAGDVLDKNDFIKHVKDEPYFVDSNKQKRIGGTNQRVLKLDINKMVDKGLDVSPAWHTLPDDDNEPDADSQTVVDEIELPFS
jgi:hypothetical protein